MEVDGAAPLYDMGDGILTAMTNSDMILRAIWFPFAAIWWMITNMFSLPYMVTSWMMLGSVWIISLPFMTVSWLVYFCLAPFRYLFGWVWIPWPWTWSLSGIIDTIGPVFTCILMAGIVGILAGIATYFIAFSLSAITESLLAPRDPAKKPNNNNSHSRSGQNTPQYDSEYESQAIPYFKNEFLSSSLSLSRRSSFTDFDTDDAAVLVQHHRGHTQTRGGPGSGADLYAAWRERVDNARPVLGLKVSSGDSGGVLRSPTHGGMVLSSGGGGGGGASGSKRRLPGLLFGTTIHEEDDDSL